jgi:hypothetical protein
MSATNRRGKPRRRSVRRWSESGTFHGIIGVVVGVEEALQLGVNAIETLL